MGGRKRDKMGAYGRPRICCAAPREEGVAWQSAAEATHAFVRFRGCV